MLLVDSSIWISYFGLQSSPIAEKLEALIYPINQVWITGIIFQEVLQGIRNKKSYDLTQKILGKFPFLLPSYETHQKAAELFQTMSSRGKTPSTIDVLIASIAIENKAGLFTLDEGFKRIARHSSLKLYELS